MTLTHETDFFAHGIIDSSDIKPLHRRNTLVGKHIKKSKSKTEWSFKVKGYSFTVELFTSKVSRKRKVLLNSVEQIMDEGASFFTHSGLSFTFSSGLDAKTDLLINSYSFAEIYSNSNRRSKIDLEGKVSEEVIILDAASRRSSTNRSSRQLRRSDASVKDFSLGDNRISLNRSTRGFRRSDASVTDLTTRGSSRGFRRSDASVRDLSLNDSTTTLQSPKKAPLLASLTDDSPITKEREVAHRSSYAVNPNVVEDKLAAIRNSEFRNSHVSAMCP